MKRMNKGLWLIVVFAWLFTVSGLAQESFLKIRKSKMELDVQKSWSQGEADSIARLYELPRFSMDSLNSMNYSKSLFSDGWSIRKVKRNSIVLQKSLLWDKVDWNDVGLVFSSSSNDHQGSNRWNPRVFGFNDFKTPTVIENSDGTTTFLYTTGPNVHSVFLSGTFNAWSTTAGKMNRTSQGWELTLMLKPGRHEYKFVVDGKWMRDPKNNLKMDDNYGDFNSVYFKPNHIFQLKDAEFKSVVVAGSFNNWDERQCTLQRANGNWQLSVFLPEGQYEYRFIADGNWMEDPTNSCVVKNEFNENNSCLSIGTLYGVEFRLQGFASAQMVILTGDFNNWNEEGYKLTLENGEWSVRLPLRKGKWEYRYIIDGAWYTDFSSPILPSSVRGEMNNYLIVDSNFEFKLEGYTNANQVLVSGDFNNWNEKTLQMRKTDSGWELPYYFDPGKITYKFIVDGNWIVDPMNDQYEINEFGGKNSILWID